MTTVLTLHQGDARAEYREHPMEVARQALREAARLEWESGTDGGMQWASILASLVNALPHRDPIMRGEVA